MKVLLDLFFNAARKDPRIGTTHVSLYCAIVTMCGTGEKSVRFKTPDLMLTAKILAIGTYHRCIRQLHEYGYICYHPTYDHRKTNSITLINLEP